MNVTLESKKQDVTYQNASNHYMYKWNKLISHMDDIGLNVTKSEYEYKPRKYHRGLLISGCMLCQRDVFIFEQNLKRVFRKPSNKIKCITCNDCNNNKRKTKSNRIKYYQNINEKKAKYDRQIRKKKNIIEPSISPEPTNINYCKNGNINNGTSNNVNEKDVTGILFDDTEIETLSEQEYIMNEYLNPSKFNEYLQKMIN